MGRTSRSSRLPTPRLPFRKRPVISAPIGLGQHNTRLIFPSCPISASAPVGNDDAIVGAESSIGKQERPARRPTPIIQNFDDSTPRPLSKSRTFNVLSGITSSFSRSSFAPSRRTTESSVGSSISLAQIATTETSLSMTTSAYRPTAANSGRLSLEPYRSDQHHSQDPCWIYTEQPSAYWTGRFNGIHDRFQGECLTPHNLQSLIDVHADHAVARNQQRHQHILLEARHSRLSACLPPSATSAAILQQNAGGGLSGDSSNDKSAAMHAADSALLLDDEARCKRVFIHLESFCATDDARRSLFRWQQDFARKMGRRKLLPIGGTMEDRALGTYMSRLGVKRIGKRASMY